jgi:hypothetical protein
MKRWIRRLSLATKLRFVIVYAAGAALLVASTLYITGEVLSLRQSLAQQLVTLARSVAQDEGSLSFANRKLAQTILESMRVDPNVRSVALYDASGQLFTRVDFGDQHYSPAAQFQMRLTGAFPAGDQTIQFRGLTLAHINVPI